MFSVPSRILGALAEHLSDIAVVRRLVGDQEAPRRREYARAAVPLAMMVLLGVSAASAAPQNPEEIVAQTSGQVLDALKGEGEGFKEDEQKLYSLVEEVVLPHFDFRQMSRRVLGPHWRDATQTQRSRFIAEFKTLLVRTYSNALLEYTDATVKIQPVRAEEGARTVIVRTQVEAQGAPSLAINYSMYRAGEAWKVYDVTVEGVSLVITYRSSFSQEIKRNGLDQLIEQLISRNGGEQG